MNVTMINRFKAEIWSSFKRGVRPSFYHTEDNLAALERAFYNILTELRGKDPDLAVKFASFYDESNFCLLVADEEHLTSGKSFFEEMKKAGALD